MATREFSLCSIFVPKHPFVFFCFLLLFFSFSFCSFCSQMRNLQLYSNSHSFSYGEIRNSFFFYHETRNLNCTQIANCFLTTTYEMFPIRHLLFENESKNLKFCPNGRSLFDREYKIWSCTLTAIHFWTINNKNIT